MAQTERLKAIDEAASRCRRQFDRMVDQAEHILENWRNERERLIQESATRVARLESELELYEGLEAEWRAARVRTELASAVEHHRATVDAANRQLEEAIKRYVRVFAAAAAAVEATFNSACGSRNFSIQPTGDLPCADSKTSPTGSAPGQWR